MLKINPYIDKIEVSLIRKIAEASQKYEGVINLTIGEPDIPPPREVIEETQSYLVKGKLGYSVLGGSKLLRDEIGEYYKKNDGIEIGPDEIIITVGATEALSDIINLIILPGDEVLIPAPAYPGYESSILLAGGTVTKIDTTESNFEITAEELKAHITPKTKAIILNYPCNPTGKTLSKKNRDEILQLVSKSNIFLISDEVYREIRFEKEYYSFLDKNVRENVFIVGGFSKSHSMTGFRVGYIIANEELRKKLLKVHQYNVTSTSAISQHSALIALQKCSDVTERATTYKERAEAVYDEFKKNGIDSVKPQGAIYIFVKVPTDDSLKFALDLLNEKKVAVVPGIAFGTEGYIRLSLTRDKEILVDAAKKIVEFIKKQW